MGFWWLALKDTILVARDRKALLTLVLMPILLIGILGAAFGELMDEEEASSIKKFKVGIANHDEGQLGSVLSQEIFMTGLPELISAEEMTDMELQDYLQEQVISVGITIPQDFSDHIISGGESEVQVVSIPSATIPSAIVENAVLQFTQAAAVNVIAQEIAGRSGIGKALPAKSQLSGDDYDFVEEAAVEQDQKPVGSFQYYAAGMGVMFLLMTVITGVSAMIDENEQDVYNRLLVTKLSSQHYLIGKFIGLLFLSCIQLFIIILGTHYLYHVRWGESMTGVFLVGFAFVFSVCGLGVLLGALVKREKTFNAAGMLATQIMAAVGGSMVPLYLFPDWVNAIVKVLPNALALQTFLELMSGAGAGQILPEAGILIAIGLGAILIAFLSLSARRRVLHA